MIILYQDSFAASCSPPYLKLTCCRSIESTSVADVSSVIESCLFVCLLCFLHLIRMTFDIKVDGELQPDAFLHRLLQSRDLLSGKLVPADKRCPLSDATHFFHDGSNKCTMKQRTTELSVRAARVRGFLLVQGSTSDVQHSSHVPLCLTFTKSSQE